MTTETYDAIVVGSGISGGWAAKELTEKGLRTIVLEAGRPIDPAVDYVEHVPPYDMRYRGMGDRKRIDRYQPIQRHTGACNEYSGKFFVNDLDNPYSFPDDKPFYWIRGRQVGGRSIMWGRCVFRWSDLDYEANAREGIAVDWPLRYRDVAPWWSYVEKFVGIQGRRENLAHLPDGEFLQPWPMNAAEQKAREVLLQKFGGERLITNMRLAVLTEDHLGRSKCHLCGHCERGCSTLSYFSSLNSTLPAARKTGRLTLRPFSVVHSVIYDSSKRRATGVRVVDGNTRQMFDVNAKVVFLCASALESTRILLNSATAEFPTGLGNSSGELGHNLMDHIMGGGASATLPWAKDRREVGNRPDAIYVPRFRNVKTKHPDFLRGYGFEGRAERAGWSRGAEMPGFGAGFKKSLIGDLGPWVIEFYGFGEMLPRHENYCEIDPHLVDAWGIPALRVHCAYSENEKKMLDDMVVSATEMCEAMGATDIKPIKDDNPPGLVIHETGTARMGRDPKTSVLNPHNQMWDARNVFVTDGACMTSTANQNPSITYMALTARAVDHAVAQLKRREL
ncbi:MAG TPA: GMC family oxidoreductase [Gemmatimonadaceae bacterium]|jgi:choline dehydrogenase-like flavoprotein|nr:GMC family oxidoreductase [Gemmatimonadaceae bacterium]